jgi:cytochrome P450
VHALEPAIRACAVALTEAVRKRGACNFTTAYAELFPIQIFMRLVDLPIDDAPRLKRWADLIIRADSEATFESAKQGLYDYLARYITARRGASGTDLLSQLANGRVAGELLPEREAVDFAVQVMIAGLDTVVNFLGFAFLYLARHPAERRELIEQPGLIAAAVEELLRRYPIVTIGREVRGEVLLDGVELRPGDMILIPTPLVGLDERLNEHAVQVDFHRQGPQHATFGEGRHACAGIHLARLELKVAVEEWLARIPQFKVAPEAELRFRGGIVAGIESLPLVWDVATTRAATEVHA